ncbi:MAG: hypothetical protein Q8M72_02625 [Methylocystis sp.]|nr:hypothetical protein [Methylocystis sp.]
MSGAPFRAPLFYPPAFGFAALSGVFAVAEPLGAEAGGVDAVGVTTVAPLAPDGGTIARREEPPAARAAPARFAGVDTPGDGAGFSAICSVGGAALGACSAETGAGGVGALSGLCGA